MRDLEFVAENRECRRRRNRLRQPRPRSVVGRYAAARTIDRYAAARTHVNPNIAVSLFAGIMPCKNPLHFQLVLAGQGWNLDAMPAASIEPPSVIAALQHFLIQPPIRKRNPPLRTRIPHR